jgi:epsilon-lactone hydrolase
MQSLRSRVIYFLVKRSLKKKSSRSLQEQRIARDRDARKTFHFPEQVSCAKTTIAGCEGEWLEPSDLGALADEAAKKISLYFHGGGYINCSCTTHRALAASIALSSMSKTLIFNYRLAPESPFPAGLNDALSVYQQLLTENPQSKFIFIGDSAGAGLALALCLKLNEMNLAKPDKLVLMSPWTDLLLSHDSHIEQAQYDPFFPNKNILKTAANLYAGEASVKEPLISPLYGDLSCLPPTLIHVGERECLLDDSVKLAEKAIEQGAHVIVKIWPKMWHVWQIFAGKMREADDSIDQIGRFINNTK